MAKLVNLARMTTATVGTGTMTLDGAVVGFLTFAAAGVNNGDVVSYGIRDGAQSEVGTGTYSTTGPTLTRTVLASTNGGAAISLSGNNAEVFVIALAQDIDAKAPLASPVFTGNPTAPTPGGGDNDTSIATTAFVQGELAAKAPLASPALTGNPTAPTPAANDNDTSIATTAFVLGQLSSAAPAGLGSASGGSALTSARSDHVHPSNFRDQNIILGSGDLNTLLDSGYWSIQNATNAPSTGDSWHHVRVQNHDHSGNAYTFQDLTTLTLSTPQRYSRVCVNGAWSTWVRILDSYLQATAGQYLSNASATYANYLSPWGIWGAAAFVTLTDGATVTPDFGTGVNFHWSLGAAGRTLANPTNAKDGQSGMIYMNAGASGTITTWGSAYLFPGAVKPQVTPNGADCLCYTVRTASVIVCTMLSGIG